MWDLNYIIYSNITSFYYIWIILHFILTTEVKLLGVERKISKFSASFTACRGKSGRLSGLITMLWCGATAFRILVWFKRRTSILLLRVCSKVKCKSSEKGFTLKWCHVQKPQNNDIQMSQTINAHIYTVLSVRKCCYITNCCSNTF